MVRDYSKRYATTGGRQKVQRRNRPGSGPGLWLWKTAGLLISLAMLGGVGTSFWFGWKIRTGLDELARHQQIGTSLQEEHAALVRQREELLAKEEIEAAAAKMGLYPPAPGQLKRP